MSETAKIRAIVEAVVSEVLETQVPALRESIVGRVTAELKSIMVAASGNSASDLLKNSIFAIQEAGTQADILRGLLDGASAFCGRAALFVLRGSVAVGWQARGFRDNEAIRILSVEATGGLGGRAMQQRIPVSGLAAQFDSRFVAGFGTPLDGNCMVLPLIIRDKVAALVYADSGLQPDGKVDSSALELLVRSAASWIELLGLRKSATATPAPTQPRNGEARLARQGVERVQAAAAGRKEPPAHAVTDRHEDVREQAEDSDAVMQSDVPPAVPKTEPAHSGGEMSAAAHVNAADEEEIHRKAKRFAKLLVEEIILYNKDKVEEGRANRDLYDRLKDDIEKSRATYDKRYAQTSAAAGDYFKQELINTLATNDPSLLGSRFSG